MEQPLKLRIHAEIKTIEILLRGISSAGFNFNFIRNNNDNEIINRLEKLRYKITCPIPDYFLIHLEDKFIIKKEDIQIIFDNDENRENKILKVFSNKYNTKELLLITQKILRHLIQQYVFHKNLSLFQPLDFFLTGERIGNNQSIQFVLRRWNFIDNQIDEITVISGLQNEEFEILINPDGLIVYDLSKLLPDTSTMVYQKVVSEIGFEIQYQEQYSSIIGK